MRRLAKAPSAGSNSGAGVSRARKSLFGVACACVLGLTALLGSGASPAAAAPCPNAQFRQGPSAALPDCRAYEQVSPVDKNGYDVAGSDMSPNFRAPAQAVALEGDAAFFRSAGAFAGFPTGGGGLGPTNLYVARRGTSDWVTVPAYARGTKPSADIGLVVHTPDLSRSLLYTSQQAFPPDPTPPSGTLNYYLRSHLTGETTLMFQSGFGDFASSTDLGHVAFSSEKELVDDPGLPPFGPKVYELVDGEVRLVSRQPGTDEPFAGEAALAGGAAGFYESGLLMDVGSPRNAGAISADGDHIFFEVPPASAFEDGDDPNTLVYRRSNGTTTTVASPSQRVPVDPQGPFAKRLLRATHDGNVVLFKSAELLTDDANTGPDRDGMDLYRYDMAADELVDVSATPGGDGARVQGVIGISDDGDRVYYVARGQVVPGQGTDGARNVYLWEDDGTPGGSTRFVATLGGAAIDAFNWTTADSEQGRSSRVNGDGRFLLLTATASLTGYDNEPLASETCFDVFGGPIPCPEIFRYDAEANGGAGSLVCVSCNPSGEPPLGPASLSAGSTMTTRALSEDGRFVFFNSTDALTSSDTNGVADVYVWSDGAVDLLSSGTDPSPSRFAGASANGEQAFIATRAALVPQDIDHNVDLYAASIGGGLLSQQAIQEPSCEGEACRGAGLQAPPQSRPLTGSFAGPGNAAKPRCAKGKRRVKGRCVRKQKRRAGKAASDRDRRTSR